MEHFIEYPEDIPKMGAASYEYCREKFEVKKVNEKMLEYLGMQN